MSTARMAYIYGGTPHGEAARLLWEALGIADRLAGARRVFIKLNLCAAQRYDSGRGIFVDTEAVLDLVAALREAAPKAIIQVGDSDSTGYAFAHDKFTRQGLLESAARGGFEVIDLTRDHTVLVDCNGEFFSVLPMARSVVRADFYVNFSKIKTHNITKVTGIIKNSFGLLPQSDKKRLHPYLDSILADIHRIKPPDLCVLDGRPAMAGDGPIHGNPVELGLTLFGTDALSTDVEMCRLMGVLPQKVSHLSHLAYRLNRDLSEQVEYVGSGERPESCNFAGVPMNQRLLIQLGLRIQSLGANMEELGHLVHFARNLGDIRKVRRFLGRVVRNRRLF